MRYCYTFTRMAKLKSLSVSNVDEDLEQLVLPYTAGGTMK